MDESRAAVTRLLLILDCVTTRRRWAEGDNSGIKADWQKFRVEVAHILTSTPINKLGGNVDSFAFSLLFCFLLLLFKRRDKKNNNNLLHLSLLLSQQRLQVLLRTSSLEVKSTQREIITPGRKGNLSQFPSCQIKEWADKSAVSGCW